MDELSSASDVDRESLQLREPASGLEGEEAFALASTRESIVVSQVVTLRMPIVHAPSEAG